MKIEDLYTLYLRSERVSTDSRKIPLNSLFFALKGEHFNGNRFASDAVKAGAKFAIVDEMEFADESKGIFYVRDSLHALQALGRYHRLKKKIPVIALTGSNGKTTTKELITAVLSEKYNVRATQGNFNNHIGVPLTLLSIRPSHEIAVVEMGANHLKEIEFLSNLVQPDYGYITNFGKAHLEGFKSPKGVIKGKSELYVYLKKEGKTVFVNADDSKQMELTKGMKRITFGTDAHGDYHFMYGSSGDGHCPGIEYEGQEIQSSLMGDYNLSNIAASVAMGLHFNVPVQSIQKAIKAYNPINNRSQIIKKKQKTILSDAYNANPSSMTAALENFSKIPGHKTVILGDMFELGDSARKEHLKIAKLALEFGFDDIILIGENFFSAGVPSHSSIRIFKTKEELEKTLRKTPLHTNHILLKGSRGMELEKLIEFL